MIDRVTVRQTTEFEDRTQAKDYRPLTSQTILAGFFSSAQEKNLTYQPFHLPEAFATWTLESCFNYHSRGLIQ